MATKEPPKSGLLAKVARFVVNPTTNWSEIDRSDVPDTLDPRQADRAAMKAMIELKRRNDFVRQREFNMLRKIRQKEIQGYEGSASAEGKPSFFQSSLPSRPDDKEQTIKKINEIEAQMSMQWWSTKHGNSSIINSSNFGPTKPPDALKPAPAKPGVMTVTGNSPVPSQEGRSGAADAKPGFVNTENHNLLDFTMEPVGHKKTEPMPLPMTTSPPVAAPVTPRTPASTSTTSVPRREFLAADSISWEPPSAPKATPAPVAAALPSLDFPEFRTPSTAAPLKAPPHIGSAATPAAPPLATTKSGPAKPQQPAPALQTSPQGNKDPSGNTEFSQSKLFAIEVEEVTHDPELEEAAIRFANGDDTGAEQTLKDALHVKNTGLLNEEAWLTLFDLYRATGNQDGYDSLALDYAGFFQRSAPTWISFPDQLKQQQAATSTTQQTSETPAVLAPHWKSPSSLGLQSIAALKAALAKAEPPWRIDCTRLAKIEDNATAATIELFKSWCETPSVQIRLESANVLADLLQRETPTGDNTTNPAWWHLRLETLRLLHRPDEFEMVALDFCVTYEVSPPSWVPAKCKCKALDTTGLSQHGGFTIINVPSSLPPSEIGSGLEGTMLGDLLGKQTTIELSGHIEGDALEAIASLNKALEGADVMVISCEKLIRIDFSAAGALLNWVIARRQEGRQVQFVQLHRLIIAFFHVIGISEHAMTNMRMH